MDPITCEQRRLQNIQDNKRILAEIGLLNPFKALPRVQFKKTGIKRKAEKTEDACRRLKKPMLEQNGNVNSEDLQKTSPRGSQRMTRRRSERLKGNSPAAGMELPEEDYEEEEDEEDRKFVRVPPNRPNHYGAIEGVEVGASWLTRMECCRDGIHRPTVAGIHSGPDGAFSVALSGGYDDNIDLGDCFTYTGEGGRDLKGTKANPKNLRQAPQTKDQPLSRGNLALNRSVETGNPVRVIRGYKLTSPFAPEEGYRYDGLYTVEKAWYTVGCSGFMVWKFALKRCKDQAPPPWNFSEDLENITRTGDTNDKENESQSQKDDKTVGTETGKLEVEKRPSEFVEGMKDNKEVRELEKDVEEETDMIESEKENKNKFQDHKEEHEDKNNKGKIEDEKDQLKEEKLKVKNDKGENQDVKDDREEKHEEKDDKEEKHEMKDGKDRKHEVKDDKGQKYEVKDGKGEKQDVKDDREEKKQGEKDDKGEKHKETDDEGEKHEVRDDEGENDKMTDDKAK